MSTTTYRAGTLADVRNLQLLDDRAIVIERDRIVAVEPWGSGQRPDDYVDLRDHLVAPGLIDLHTHLIGSLDHGSSAPFITKSASWAALQGVRNAAATLRSGFTTVRDLGTFRAFIDCDLRDAIDGGIVPGPRMFTTGGYVTSSTGGGEITDLVGDIPLPPDFRIGVADSADEVRRAVRTFIHGGADLIKIIATGAGFTAGTVPGAPEFSEAEIRAAVEEAALYGKYVAAHAHGTLGAMRAVRAGVRTLDHGSYIDGDEIFDLLLERDTFYVPTTFVIKWVESHGASDFPAEVRRKVHEGLEISMEALRTAVRRGVKLAYGTDAIIFPHGANAMQMVDFAEAGMPGIEILRTATLNAADAIGTEDVGAIEPGRFADFIAIKGIRDADDVRVFQDVDLVVKGGAVVA